MRGRKRTPSLLVETLRARLTQMPLLSLHGTACNACRQTMPSVPIVNQFLPRACLAIEKSVRGVCNAAYAPGMGTVPWVLNSEIYLLRYRGLGGGIVAVSNWCANLIMSESFLSMTESLGIANIFLLVVGFSLVCQKPKPFSSKRLRNCFKMASDLFHQTRRTTKSIKRRITPSN
ncbi:Inositol transporter 4 [Glycine soja]